MKNIWYILVFFVIFNVFCEIKVNVGGYGECFLVGNIWWRYVMFFQVLVNGFSWIIFIVGDENINVWLDMVYFFKGNVNVFRCDFENGIVVVNGLNFLMMVDLGGIFQCIKGIQDFGINNGQSLKNLLLNVWDVGILIWLKKGGLIVSMFLVIFLDIDVCGFFVINFGFDQGFFFWKDCNVGIWYFIVLVGGDSSGNSFMGIVFFSGGFNFIDLVDFEKYDVLDMVFLKVDFKLKVWNKGIDGIDMVLFGGFNICFRLNVFFGCVYIGFDKVEVLLFINLNILK